MKVIGYTRVSTEEQGRSGLGVEAQRAAIEAGATLKGWVVEWASDVISGKSLDRPALQFALAQLEAGNAQAIVAARLDRLSRSVVGFGQLLEVSRRQGWAIVVLDFELDTTTAAGRMLAGIMVQFAQFERELIGERNSATVQARRARGERVGQLTRVSDEAHARIGELRGKGLGLSAIAGRMNAEGFPTPNLALWRKRTVWLVLRRLAEGWDPKQPRLMNGLGIKPGHQAELLSRTPIHRCIKPSARQNKIPIGTTRTCHCGRTWVVVGDEMGRYLRWACPETPGSLRGEPYVRSR